MAVQRALISVPPSPDLPELAGQLVQAGWELIATPQACDQLTAAGVPAIQVGHFNGVAESFHFPPTLHPKMERALTEDCEYRIDLVYDLIYPLSQGNDIGGHTLLALAAKGNRIPVPSTSAMRRIAGLLAVGQVLPESERKELIDQTNQLVARHYLEVAALHAPNRHWGGIFNFRRQLQNGENPYQTPAFLAEDSANGDPLAIPGFSQVAGVPPCFTNLADLDCIVETLCRLTVAARSTVGAVHCAIAAKHGNPCGIGISRNDPREAIERALWGNPQAIWGGEVIVNFPIDQHLAEALAGSGARESRFGSRYWMLDVIAAPDFSEQAKATLEKNPNRKLFVNPALALPVLRTRPATRPVRGGMLVQPPANYLLDVEHLDWSGEQVAETQKIDLLIAWAAAYTSNLGGNEVALAKDSRLLVVSGAPATVQAVETALLRAGKLGHELAGAVFAADAFFPFTDAPKLLCDASIIAGVVPAGGKEHEKVAAFFRERNVCVGFIPPDKRGFCRH